MTDTTKQEGSSGFDNDGNPIKTYLSGGFKTTKHKTSELPVDWRYNARELRMEHRVPCYDENENYEKHVWVALVPDDIKEYVASQRHQLISEFEEKLESGKASEAKDVNDSDYEYQYVSAFNDGMDRAKRIIRTLLAKEK